MMQTQTEQIPQINQSFEMIVSAIKNNLPFSHTAEASNDIAALKEHITNHELKITETIIINKRAKVNYLLIEENNPKSKAPKDTKLNEKRDLTFWNILSLEKDSWILDEKTTFLHELQKEKNWRQIKTDRITFLFDYNIKKQADSILAASCETELKKIETLFNITLKEPITYFVGNDIKSLHELGFKRSYSSHNTIISTFPCDIFELINFTINHIGSPPKFLSDGLAVYYAKFVANSSSDTLQFNSAHIDRMAKEVISNTPLPKIKKLLDTSAYHEALHFLFIFTLMFTSKNQKVNHDLVLLSPATSFMKYLCEGDFSNLTQQERLKNIIILLKIKEPKEIKKEFKKLFGLRIQKCERYWKKWLKSK